MSSDEPAIQHVSDTAHWVAQYRATETARPDALFRDELAGTLVGERGHKIAKSIGSTSRYSSWSVVIRTVLIDRILQEYVSSGRVDAVVNLGAGLDTRPYRLALPEHLPWIEIDYPDVIAHKQSVLAAQKPGVMLQHIPLDLSRLEERRAAFARLAGHHRKILVLTEGVIPYLTEEEVASLADDLHAEGNIRYWVGEYYTPEIYRYFKDTRRMRHMRHAPFRFFPDDWLGLFRRHGWSPYDVRYLSDEARRVGRPMPLPWWARLMLSFAPAQKKEAVGRRMAYIVFGRVAPDHRP